MLAVVCFVMQICGDFFSLAIVEPLNVRYLNETFFIIKYIDGPISFFIEPSPW